MVAHETETAERVYLSAEAEPAARAWQRDRARVYAYLHAGHRNLALHAMLRKAVDLSAATGILPDDFFDLTDRQALRLLGGALDRGLAGLVRDAQAGAAYVCAWEAVVADAAAAEAIRALVTGWRERLALEAHLAAEAALPSAAVVADLLTSSAVRELPPIGGPEGAHATASEAMDAPVPTSLLLPVTPAPTMLRLFAPAGTGHDYLRRLRVAAERAFGPLGAAPVATEQPGG